jgi:hypothetical protein
MLIADCPNAQQLCLGGGGVRVVAVARASGTQEGWRERKARGGGDAMRRGRDGTGRNGAERAQNGRC